MDFAVFWFFFSYPFGFYSFVKRGLLLDVCFSTLVCVQYTMYYDYECCYGCDSFIHLFISESDGKMNESVGEGSCARVAFALDLCVFVVFLFVFFPHS